MKKNLVAATVVAATLIGLGAAATARADGTTPPPWDFYGVSQLGQEPVRGSGCGGDGSIGDVIPDGYWRGYLVSDDGTSIDFDLACVYFNEVANSTPVPDGWLVNNKTRTRTVPRSPGFVVSGTRYQPDGSVSLAQPDVPFDAHSDVWMLIANGQAQWAVSGPTTPAAAVTQPAPTVAGTVIGMTDTDPTHWTPSSVEVPQRHQVRVFGDTPQVVDGFPVTMNGCATRQLRVAWRSLGDPLIAGYTSFLDPGMAVVPEAEAAAATAGDLILNSCEQPTFRGRVPTSSTTLLLRYKFSNPPSATPSTRRRVAASHHHAQHPTSSPTRSRRRTRRIHRITTRFAISISVASAVGLRLLWTTGSTAGSSSSNSLAVDGSRSTLAPVESARTSRSQATSPAKSADDGATETNNR